MPQAIARTSKLAENRETRIEVEDKVGPHHRPGIKVHNRYDPFYLFQEWLGVGRERYLFCYGEQILTSASGRADCAVTESRKANR